MNERVTTDPKVLAGHPVIRGTQIPVYPILERLAAGNSRGDIVLQHPQLRDEDIPAAIECASQVRKGEPLEA